MNQDLKIDDLNPCEDVEHEGQPEDSKAKETKQLQVIEPDNSGPKLDRLLVEQLCFSVPETHPETKSAIQRAEGAIELYRDFRPVDATELALARVAVGLTNATMDGLDRAASLNHKSGAREMELRLSQKSAATLIDVLTLLQKHRGLDRPQVNVGSVNIGSGGQAIVGNVQSAPKREEQAAVMESDEAITPGKKRRGTSITPREARNAKPSQA